MGVSWVMGVPPVIIHVERWFFPFETIQLVGYPHGHGNPHIANDPNDDDWTSSPISWQFSHQLRIKPHQRPIDLLVQWTTVCRFMSLHFSHLWSSPIFRKCFLYISWWNPYWIADWNPHHFCWFYHVSSLVWFLLSGISAGLTMLNASIWVWYWLSKMTCHFLLVLSWI